MLRVVFMSLNLMLSKFTVICFCEAQIVLFQSFICITSVIFSLITHVVVTSSFWLCSKFFADKLQLPMPTLQTCRQSNHYIPGPALQTCQIWTPAKVPRPAVECPSDAQRNAWSLRFFSSTVKVCCFRLCVSVIRWQQIRATSKTGNLPTCSQES